MFENDGSLGFKISVDDSDLDKAERKAKQKFGSITNTAMKESRKLDMSLSSIGKSLPGLIGPAVALGAAFKFQQMAQEALMFENAFGMAMREVQTISKAAQDDFSGISDKLADMAANGRDNAILLANAFYQIVSAGYDGEEGLMLLEISSKAATAGITDTKTAADGLTTVLNAWGVSADNAGKVADVMFKTVERGKTTFGELASTIAQVAPLAASNNIAFEEIFASIQSITKQGTPTAQAMTQIRSSIINLNKVLGDGWSDTMTYQEGLNRVAEMAGGSQNKLKQLIPDVEGVNAVLALTGEKAAGAAEDLSETAKAAGAMNKAYGTMMEEADNKWSVVHNKWIRELRALGAALKEGSGDIATFLDALLSRPGDSDFLSYFDNRVNGFSDRVKFFRQLGQGMSTSLLSATSSSDSDIQSIIEKTFGNTYDLEVYKSKLDTIIGGTGTLEEKQKAVNDEYQQFVKYLEAGGERDMIVTAIETTSEYDKKLKEVNSTTDARIEKIRTLKEMTEDLKTLQEQMGTGTVSDDIGTLAKMEVVKQEIRDYYERIREVQKIEPSGKVKAVGKDPLGTYQSITKEQAKQEFQGRKILKNDEASRKEAEIKNAVIEEQNSAYLKQVKITEDLQESFSGASEVLGALSYAVGELDQDAGEALGRMADLAYNAANLVTAIGSKDLLGAVTSGIGMLGGLFGLLKGGKEDETLIAIERMNNLLKQQSAILTNLAGTNYFNLAKKQYEDLGLLIDSYNEKLKQNSAYSAAEYQRLRKMWESNKQGISWEAYLKASDQQGLIKGLDTSLWTPDKFIDAYTSGSAILDEQQIEWIQDVVELQKQRSELLQETYRQALGFDSENVADSIFQGIEDGLQLSENSLGDWSNNFGDLLKKALTQGIIESLNTKYLADFMEHFNASMDDGALSVDERENLENLYREAVEGAKAQWDAVASIFEEYEAPSNALGQGIAGQISRSITEDTASELVGLWNRTALDTRAIRDYSRDALDNLVSIQFNTANTVSELQKAVQRLDRIVSNTQNSGSR